MRQFEVVIMLGGNEQATTEQAEIATKELLARACRASPDHRFDWSTASVKASPYTENPRAR